MNLRSIRTRTITFVGALGAVVGLTATAAGAQATPPGGPFANGMLTSISGSGLTLQRTNPADQSQTEVSVTLTGSTTYQKVQQTSTDAITTGACVRVAGTGSVAKGKITASTVAITGASSSDCTRPRGNGAGPGDAGSAPGSTTANGSNPPRGSFPRNGNGRRRAGGFALGSVQSVKGNEVVVKAAEFSGRRQSGGSQAPSTKTKNVKVTLSSSTAVTQLVDASQSDLATGQCVSAAGTGDAEAITAQRVTISPPVNGACMGFGLGGGGGGEGRGGSTT